MTVPPSRFYRGPVRSMEPGYGSPYSIAPFCPQCGSTKIIDIGAVEYRCQSCGREFVRQEFYYGEGTDGKYAVFENGYEIDGGPYRLSELHDVIWGIFMDDLDDHYVSEKAADYYSDYIEDLVDQGLVEDSDEGRTEAEYEFWYDMPSIELNDALVKYIPYLGPGEVFNFPDFPISVKRVESVRKKASGTGKKPARKQTKKVTSANRKPVSKAKNTKANGKKPVSKARRRGS